MAEKQQASEGGDSDAAQTKNRSDSGAADDNSQSSDRKFPVVGLGASAGGLQALKSFFGAVPDDSGIAYIVVIHLASDKPSMMPELLQKVSSIPVTTAEDGKRIEPNHVYVVPPGHEIRVKDGAIVFSETEKDGHQHTIDRFFRSLARDQGIRSAGIVLSGTGTDGSVGLREIKGVGGLALVQSEETAQHAAMPRSAMDTGNVDQVLAPEQMPDKLQRYFSRYIAVIEKAAMEDEAQQEWLDRIFNVLRSETGHDFSHYKVNTLLRRIALAVNEDPELSTQWLPLTFPEEQYNISDLGDLWLNCLDALGDALEQSGKQKGLFP